MACWCVACHIVSESDDIISSTGQAGVGGDICRFDWVPVQTCIQATGKKTQ